MAEGQCKKIKLSEAGQVEEVAVLTLLPLIHDGPWAHTLALFILTVDTALTTSFPIFQSTRN